MDWGPPVRRLTGYSKIHRQLMLSDFTGFAEKERFAMQLPVASSE